MIQIILTSASYKKPPIDVRENSGKNILESEIYLTMKVTIKYNIPVIRNHVVTIGICYQAFGSLLSRLWQFLQSLAQI